MYKFFYYFFSIYKPGLFVYYIGLRDYLFIVRKISFHLTKKYKRYLIYKLKTLALHNQFIEIIFAI